MAANCENSPNAAPTFSIVVPVYNAAKYLRNCLESCRMQALGDFEVLCVDDGSTDASPALLAEFAARDNRFRVFHQRNLGAGPARNMALDEARGQYVCFLDADDFYPSPNALEALRAAAAESGYDIVGGGKRIVREDGTLYREIGFPRTGPFDYRETQQQYDYQRYLFSRSLLERTNLRFPALRRRQDPPFFVQALLSAGRYFAIGECVYCYRWRGHGVNIDWMADDGVRLGDHLRGLEMVADLADKNGLDRLYVRNALCLTHFRAFRRAEEIRRFEGELRDFVRRLRLSGKLTPSDLRALADSFALDVHPRSLRAGMLRSIFGLDVFLGLVAAHLPLGKRLLQPSVEEER